MLKNILIIVNPKAGKKESQKNVPKIISDFKEKEFEVDVKDTTIESNATKIIENYEKNFDLVIVIGGDGTLKEVVQGLQNINKKVCINFIPFGTTNDFAKSLIKSDDSVPILSLKDKEYFTKEADTGIIADEIFNYVVCFGIFSKTSYATSRFLKNILGRPAYVVSGLKEIFVHRSYKIKIESEEQNLEGKFIYGSISNSKYIGGFNLFKNEKIELDDGKFEALFVKKPKNIFKTWNLIIKVLSGNFNDKNIYFFQTSNIKISSSDDIEISIDGEYGGNRKEIEIKNIEKNTKYIFSKNMDSYK